MTIPLKHRPDGLGEFENGDKLAYEFGGTNSNSLAEAQENLGINAKASLEYVDNGLDTKLDKIDYIQHFRGVFSSFAALTAALPIALDGDYAHIDSGSGFDRMVAIFDTDDSTWKVSAANVGANTDEVPEGSINLYFKSKRVLDTPLTGLTNQPAMELAATDKILEAIGKLQAQIHTKSNAGPVEWVDAVNVFKAGTLNALVLSATVNGTVVPLQFAKINGMLWIKGCFTTNTTVDANRYYGELIDSYKIQAYKVGSQTEAVPINTESLTTTNTGRMYIRSSAVLLNSSDASSVTQGFRLATGDLANNLSYKIFGCLGVLVTL
ncbi:hypothetical protein [Acinetobacter silvestris]|uniref:Uncharacterized protein n=1 Tax=Acinetobacter silvestris TaxID=1977882 RepID=A0A1Y3CJN6_9GAMM|nr:hypothetical protein [Acinetobacter silvestris]OTG65836.1 hypothetical protein B9T28_06450 [Acinetobacter silvestris]